MISDSLSKDFATSTHPSVSDELQGIVQTFYVLKSELQLSITSKESPADGRDAEPYERRRKA